MNCRMSKHIESLIKSGIADIQSKSVLLTKKFKHRLAQDLSSDHDKVATLKTTRDLM